MAKRSIEEERLYQRKYYAENRERILERERNRYRQYADFLKNCHQEWYDKYLKDEEERKRINKNNNAANYRDAHRAEVRRKAREAYWSLSEEERRKRIDKTTERRRERVKNMSPEEYEAYMQKKRTYDKRLRLGLISGTKSYLGNEGE